MPILSPELRQLVESGPMAHLTTINADGSPQVSVIWIGLDGEDLTAFIVAALRAYAMRHFFLVAVGTFRSGMRGKEVMCAATRGACF